MKQILIVSAVVVVFIVASIYNDVVTSNAHAWTTLNCQNDK